MRKTGVFYHDQVGQKAYKTLAMSVEEGFDALQKEGLLNLPNVTLFESKPVSEDLILTVHPQSVIDMVKSSGYFECSLYSIGSVLQATEQILKGNIDNALAIAGVGGHHASRTSFWGGCFFNIAAIAIQYARSNLGARKFAIVDTDTHHGDGTRQIFQDDEDVLHICFCWSNSDKGSKVCLPHCDSDSAFLQLIQNEVPYRLADFKPEMIYWVCGLDTHKDSYGTRKLTEDCYHKQAKILLEAADKICQGRLLVKIGCNAPAHVSEYVLPRLVDVLAGLNKYPENK